MASRDSQAVKLYTGGQPIICAYVVCVGYGRVPMVDQSLVKGLVVQVLAIYQNAIKVKYYELFQDVVRC